VEICPKTYRGLAGSDDFIAVRDEAALAKFPEAERQEWRKLWGGGRGAKNEGNPGALTTTPHTPKALHSKARGWYSNSGKE
jgi:hypothetical protein